MGFGSSIGTVLNIINVTLISRLILAQPLLSFSKKQNLINFGFKSKWCSQILIEKRDYFRTFGKIV